MRLMPLFTFDRAMMNRGIIFNVVLKGATITYE
jgi:hypothetical protein